VFDANSKRFCDVCQSDVKIGFGGEANWTTHLNSGPHTHARAAMQKNKISNYFSKASEQPTPSSSISQPERLISTVFATAASYPSDEPGTVNFRDLDITALDNNEDSPMQALDLPPSSGSLINQLRAVTQSLPSSIAIGTEDDVLAQFSEPLVVNPNECDDAWQMIDKILNGAIGYDMSVAGVTAIIRRGRLGMDGMCDWLEACISKHGVHPMLLEGKIQRLLDAMNLLCV